MIDLDNLWLAMQMCGGGAHVTVNPHKAFYESAETYYEGKDMDMAEWVGGEATYREALRRDHVCSVQWYPHTPIGSITMYHYDLRTLLSAVKEVIE